jgi:hypothetical protein
MDNTVIFADLSNAPRSYHAATRPVSEVNQEKDAKLAKSIWETCVCKSCVYGKAIFNGKNILLSIFKVG